MIHLLRILFFDISLTDNPWGYGSFSMLAITYSVSRWKAVRSSIILSLNYQAVIYDPSGHCYGFLVTDSGEW